MFPSSSPPPLDDLFDLSIPLSSKFLLINPRIEKGEFTKERESFELVEFSNFEIRFHAFSSKLSSGAWRREGEE